MSCQGFNKKGKPCEARVQGSSGFCFFHNPQSHETRRDAQSRGGRGRHVTSGVLVEPEMDFEDPQQVRSLVGTVTRMMLRRQIDAKTLHAVCHAAEVWLKFDEVQARKEGKA